MLYCFFFNDTATTDIYTYCHTLSLHDALPICLAIAGGVRGCRHLHAVRRKLAEERRTDTGLAFDSELRVECFKRVLDDRQTQTGTTGRSEEHTSELQSLMRISYAVFCLKKKNKK